MARVFRKSILIIILILLTSCSVPADTHNVGLSLTKIPAEATDLEASVSTLDVELDKDATTTITPQTTQPTITSFSSTTISEPASAPSPTVSDVCEALLTSKDLSSMTIAFTTSWYGDKEIYTIRADGSELKQLTSNDIDDWAPVWSEDGQKIAFLSGNAFGDVSRLNVMNSDGSERLSLTELDLSVSPDYVWAPDNRHIAFAGNGDIYTVNLEDFSLTNLTKGEVLFSNRPTWSPDAQVIGFDAALDSQGSILRVHTVGIDGSNLREVASNAYRDFYPRWHGEQDQILFLSALNPGVDAEQLYLMDGDGTSRKQLTDSQTRKQSADFSPDGHWIVYEDVSWAIDPEEGPKITEQAIRVLNIKEPSPRTIIASASIVKKPSWAPDSRHIAFLSAESGSFNLYVADICENVVTRVVKDVSNSYLPSWQPQN